MCRYTISYIFVFILSILSFCACTDEKGDDLIWDVVPITAKVTVEDARGNDLIASRKIDPVKITVTYRGQQVGVYTPDELEGLVKSPTEIHTKPAPTRALPVQPYGAWIGVDQKSGKHILHVGEYPCVDTEKEEIIIDWGNGRQSVITFKVQVQYGRNSLKITEEWFLDGTYVKGLDAEPIKVVL